MHLSVIARIIAIMALQKHMKDDGKITPKSKMPLMAK